MIQGNLYYVSDDAKRKRHYREGQHVTISEHHRLTLLSPHFFQVDLDSTGTNYVHLQETNQ